ncbi:MAG: DUF3667 domain-containing protein [Bacteroidia bacterium]|nr:DUF3667 domain-containing protein [Bacteroidia bacterium]
MSKHSLRHEKNCLNCGSYVKDRFCGHCGQENTETRQTFGHLVKHFVEDITHYDGAFWKTMKYLLFKPSHLTKEFLAGKRNSYLPPVRLYIFISFITFFIPYLLPEFPDEFKYPLQTQVKVPDNEKTEYGIGYKSGRIFYAKSRYSSVLQYDSAQKALPVNQREGWFDRWTSIKTIELGKMDPDELENRYMESFGRNIPKALFVYMPLFALIIRLFHSRKKNWFFDHAIFTIHYFSFVLLIFSFLYIINTLVPTPYLFDNELFGQIFVSITTLIAIVWFIFYFYRAHYKTYKSKRWVSFLKSCGIFVINTVLFFALVIGLGLITIINLH